MIIRQTALTTIALGLLAACAGPSTSPITPGASPTQAQDLSPKGVAPDRKSVGKVLYIADIDGQPGVGQIWVYTASMTHSQFVRKITSGAGRPFGLWVDRNNILYVANETDKYPASVTAFKPGASSPFFTITEVKGQPGSVAVDATGNVYVNENYGDEGIVQVFAPGSTSPSRTIDTGVGGYAFDPGSMAFDGYGNLIVAEQAKLALHVVKIVPRSWTVTPLNLDLANISGPGLGIDKAGNLYIASSSGGTVSVFGPGQTEPSRTISPMGAYGLTWVTPQGAVYQASGEYSVAEVAPGASSPTFTLTCTCSAQGVAVSR